ncbi:MAG: glycerophosphodiester phosphodiesterase, partial [Anaerolineales bacterium]
IPRLEDVFECLGDRILYNLELTEYNRVATDVTAKTIAMVSKFGLQKQVLYSSFNPLELFRAARFVSSDRIALLVHEKTPPIVRWFVRSLTPHSTYHPYDGLVTEKLVSKTRIKGKRVNVWTVNDEVRMRTLLSWGVDGIITDYPDRAVKLRNELGAINE